MQSTATIQGTVTDSISSLPISGALVQAIRGNRVRYSTTTAADGTYTLSNVEPSNYTLVFSASGHRTFPVGVKARNNQVTTVNVSLVPVGGTISGTVTDAISSTPIVGASVFIFKNSILIAVNTTNASGVYTANNLAPGPYIVLVTATNFRGQVEGARVSVGMTTTVNFALQPNPGTISGQVTDALTSEPLRDAQIQVFNGPILVGFDNTNINGNYSVSSLPPGNYIVVASSMNYDSQSVGATVVSNATTTVNFALTQPPGTIAGSVIDANTLNPIPGATISIFQNEVLIQSLLTDIDGNYEASGLAPGNYFVVVQADNYQSAGNIASVSENNTTIVNFSLSPNPGTISGTITDAVTTNPISEAQILIFSGSQLITSTVSDQNGTYEVPNLAPGDYFVLVRASTYQAAFSLETVTAGATTTANFALNQNAGSATGQISSLCDGAPIPGAFIVVLDGSVVVGFDLTDINGNYTIDELAPGNYTLEVLKQKFLASSASITIVANAATTTNLSLTPQTFSPTSIAGTVIKNRFLTQKDQIHSISWTASPGLCVTGYKIFRNGTFLAFVPSSDPLTYMDHNRKSKDVYTVTAINSLGQESSGISITLPQ